ncbi:hypothetical protein H0H81_000305 [Sphagnurus paluster]|uniref:Uncharacterized protein n=1 Tax=Sphagnurus paluster TaxID=117069 RepID=A0A9P7FN02_9AGAR|nr:hypothetical protein H0H81_000305 [Sphagnurus paluster]
MNLWNRFKSVQDQDAFDVPEPVLTYIDTAIARRLVDGPREINVLQWMTRAALEMIGQSGLGHSFDSLEDEGSENNYTKSVKEILPTAFKFIFIQEFLLVTLVKIGSLELRRAFLDLLPFKSVRKLIAMTDVLDTTSREILDGKQRAFEKGDEAIKQQVGQGKDIISILMKANVAASERERLSNEEVLGEVTILQALPNF